jgi:hypothetical protein
MLLFVAITTSAATSTNENISLNQLFNEMNVPLSVTVLESQRNIYDAQQGTLDIQRQEIRRQLALLEHQDRAIVDERILIPIRINQENLIVRERLQTEYYNVCLLYENENLLYMQLDALNTQIAIEEVRLSFSETTYNALELLRANREIIREKITANQVQIDSVRRSLETRVSANAINGISFYIPEFIEQRNTMTHTELQNRLINNNISIIEQDRAIENLLILQDALKDILGEDSSYYIEVAAQRNSLIAQREEFKTQLILYANSRHSEYLRIESEYRSAIAIRDALLSQLNILESMYFHGEISELEWLSSKYEIHVERFNIKAAIVAQANILHELELISNGIVLGFS